MNKKVILILIIVSALLPVLVFAQGVTTAAFNGLIVDSEGVPLPGVTVSAVHAPTGTISLAVTRSTGQFSIPSVRTGGPYSLTASLPGFREGKQSDIYVQLGEDKTVDFVLEIAAIDAGEIVVTAEANPVINPARTGASQNVSAGLMESLPSIERNLADFARLSPQFDSNPEAPGSFSSAGKNNRYNNVQIDGAVNNDLFGLAASGTPGGQAETNIISLDAIQEFQIVVSPYDVRHGGFTGGGINAVTKSGSNQFQGTLFGFGRNQNFVGDGPGNTAYTEFDELRYGFSLGGPIIKNKAFFFVNSELKRKNTPDQWLLNDSGSLSDWGGNNVSMTDADRFVNILKSKYGYANPVDYGQFTRDTDSANLFARLDFNINPQHRLTIRHNYVNGNNDLFFGRDWNTFGLSDTNYLMKNKTNSTVFELNSSLSHNIHNELIVNYTTVRDRRAGEFRPFPEVTVNVRGSYEFKAGTEQYSTQNELDQDIIEVTDNLTFYPGRHTFTLGTHNEFFKFRNLFIPANFGVYSFASLDDFESEIPSYYKYVYSNTDDAREAARFWVLQFGFYANDTWTVLPNLRLTLGARVDIPVIPDRPTENPDIGAIYGVKTDQIPSGKLHFSPRLGFNWDVKDDQRTQVRGGIGLFSGRTPYVWISNQFSNTGIEFTRIEVNGKSKTPRFVADPYRQPTTGFSGATNEINLIDKDFKFPQVLRASLAIDQRLPLDFIGTVEFISTRTISDVNYQNLNIRRTGGALGDGRPLFGVPGSYGAPNYVSSKYSSVIYLTQSDIGYQHMLSFQLQKYSKRVQFNGSYTYGMSKDRNSGTSSQARSNWRYNPTTGDPNNPPLSYSVFDSRHQFKLAVTFNFPIFSRATTSFSIFYNGRSGYPYSTIYYGDANGDGERGNDLIYVPRNSDEIILVSNNWDQLDAFIKGDPALESARGSIIGRNASREPWQQRIDLRFAQDIPVPGLRLDNLQLTLDILNFASLLNKDWGKYEYISFDDSALSFLGVDAATGKSKVSFSPRTSRYIVNDFLSRWTMQFGLRYKF